MAVVNTIARFPGVGGILTQRLTIALSGASQQTTNIVASGNLAQTTSAGWVRVKVLNGGSADVTCAVIVQLTDGTGTVIIGNTPATAVPNVASSGMDFIFEYNLDINANNLAVLTTLAGTTKTATLDIELFSLP